MSHPNPSDVRKMSWAERLKSLLEADPKPETEASKDFFHRRGAMAAMMIAPAAVLAVGSTADAASPPAIGSNAADFKSIRAHENAHVTALENALDAIGDAIGMNVTRPKPTFKNLEQRRFIDFARVSQALENTGVGAYLGATPYIDNAGYLSAAASIALIEARHAGFLNGYLGNPITAGALDNTEDRPFEEALTPAQVVAAAGGFIKSLNGGPPVDYNDDNTTTSRTPTNDIAILNFALALEYLEAEFYNVNVPKFFKK